VTRDVQFVMSIGLVVLAAVMGIALLVLFRLPLSP
jgi:hypothetical protein